jgi:glycogen operon protein
MSAVDFSALVVSPGRPYPLGPVVYEHGLGTRFTIFSRHATRVWLCLYRSVADLQPAWEYEYDPTHHRVGDVWSIFVEGVGEGVYYKYRMDGPFEPARGHRFNPDIHLLDPYARAFAGDIHDGTMKCVTVHDRLNGVRDLRLHIPLAETVIYEAHVRGLTAHPSSGVAHPGTYRGLMEKIPYLKDLGINAVELLPVQEFGENLLGRCSLLTGKELTNYWGYSSIGFFAPAGRYACSAQCKEHLDEFREMVAAMHEAGIQVYLDVVFNHTSEGNEKGPTLCFRGIDNAIYYLMDGEHYRNYSGCGNTVNCNHPLVRDFILDCLRYWVAFMHVDGFRFDLASILGRDRNGIVQSDAPLIERIAEDPVLRGTKLIAEAWDAGGAYQVGSFGNARWAEWNGRYRDDVRRYWRGDPGMRAALATRITGSADLYQWGDRRPEHSINFVTCHDGFTLRDLVSYTRKRNWANGEGNRDGSDHENSFNCGAEGDTDDAFVNLLRMRQQKNLIGTLLLSLGVPMLLGGDEFGRTQRGNNNAYCQDNEVSWHDWRLVERNAELHRFTRAAIALRRAHPVFQRNAYFLGAAREDGVPDASWHAPDGDAPDWGAPDTPLALRVHGALNGGTTLYLLFNNTHADVDFALPPGPWRVHLDTGRAAPLDIDPGPQASVWNEDRLPLVAHSMALLASDAPPQPWPLPPPGDAATEPSA